MSDALRRRLRRVAVVAGAVLALSGCGATGGPVRPAANLRMYDVIEPAPSIDQLASTVGFADSDVLGLPPELVDGSVGLLKALKVSTVRLLIPWAAIERTPGAYDWSMVDKTVDAAFSRGISILATLNSPPAWAVLPGQPAVVGRPASAATFGQFAGKVAEHFRGKVAAYEVWNEPNAASFFAPAPDPAGYVDLLKAAYPAIKGADPSALVVSGGLGAVVDYSTIAMDPVKFASAMYAAGAKDFFDALAYHPYQYTMQFSASWHPDAPINQLAGLRQLMVVNGDAAKRIWATEYGEPSSAVGEEGQAAYLDDMLSTWQTIPYAGPVYVYTLHDRDSHSTDADDTLGIYRSDGTAKPAEAVIRSRVTQRGVLVQQATTAPR